MAFIAPPPPGMRVPTSTGLETSLARAVTRLRRQPVVPVALVAGTLLVLVHGWASNPVLVGGSHTLATVGGAVLAVVGARRADPARGAGWRWVAGGLTVSALADVVRTVLHLGMADAAAWSPWVDAGWMVGAVALGAATFARSTPAEDDAVGH